MVEAHGTDGFITTKDGLLWRDGKMIDLPEADRVAWKKGFNCAERYVKHLLTTGETK
jgi:hypothetical protein